MPSLVYFDTSYGMEGEGFGKEFSAQMQFFADLCLVPVTVVLRDMVIDSLRKNKVGHLVENHPPDSHIPSLNEMDTSTSNYETRT